MKKICIIAEKGKERLEKYILGRTGKFDAVLEFLFSSDEGAMIDRIHKCYYDKCDGIVLNAGILSEYSIAVRDAVSAVSGQIETVEVMQAGSGPESVIAPVCKGQIKGFGDYAYVLAVKYLTGAEVC